MLTDEGDTDVRRKKHQVSGWPGGLCAPTQKPYENTVGNYTLGGWQISWANFDASRSKVVNRLTVLLGSKSIQPSALSTPSNGPSLQQHVVRSPGKATSQPLTPSKHILNAQVAIRAPCCKKFFDVSWSAHGA